jgi:hypothetical protein
MIPALIQFLIAVLVVVIVFYIIKLVATHFGAPPLVVQLVGLILALILILLLLQAVGGIPGWHRLCP